MTHTGAPPSTQSRTPMDNWVVIVCFVALKGRENNSYTKKIVAGRKDRYLLPHTRSGVGIPLTPKKQRTRLMVRYKKTSVKFRQGRTDAAITARAQ
jgi:hypothetical protein